MLWIQRQKTCFRADCDRLARAFPFVFDSAFFWTTSCKCIAHMRAWRHLQVCFRGFQYHSSCQWTHGSSSVILWCLCASKIHCTTLIASPLQKRTLIIFQLKKSRHGRAQCTHRVYWQYSWVERLQHAVGVMRALQKIQALFRLISMLSSTVGKDIIAKCCLPSSDTWSCKQPRFATSTWWGTNPGMLLLTAAIEQTTEAARVNDGMGSKSRQESEHFIDSDTTLKMSGLILWMPPPAPHANDRKIRTGYVLLAWKAPDQTRM